MKCELCGKTIWRWQEYEVRETRDYYKCDGWQTYIDIEEYAHQKCIMECKK